MQRVAGAVLVYSTAIVLFVVLFALGLYVVKSTNAIHPSVVLGACGGIYTMAVLYILHRRAGTLAAAPGEVRQPERVPENEMDGI